MEETSGSTTVCTKLERIAKLARQAPGMAFTTLAQHIDIDWLKEHYRRTRKGRSGGRGRADRERVRSESGGEPSVAAGAG